MLRLCRQRTGICFEHVENQHMRVLVTRKLGPNVAIGNWNTLGALTRNEGMAAGIFSLKLASVAVSTLPRWHSLINQLTQESSGATSTFEADAKSAFSDLHPASHKSSTTTLLMGGGWKERASWSSDCRLVLGHHCQLLSGEA